MNDHNSNPSETVKPANAMLGTVADPSPADQATWRPRGTNPGLYDLGLDHRRPGLEHLSGRLSEDFRLAIVSLFGLVAFLIILPFMIFRFVSGDWHVALLDVGILSVIAIGLVLSWRFGLTQWAGNIMATAAIAGVGTLTIGFDQSLLWVTAALVVGFLLASSGYATILSLTLISLVMVHDQAFAGPVERWTFLAVSVQVALYSLIFSLRSNQRTESLAFLAETDPLTGLGNRRALRYDLTKLVGQNRRQNSGLALAMFDLDHFKRVNDQYGHEAGDRVLQDFAGILAQSTRESDQGYRFGGEEFLLILQGVDASGLEIALDKLHKRVREVLASPGGPVTVSTGATRVLPGDTLHECFQRADQAMYMAKAQGRDRFEIL